MSFIAWLKGLSLFGKVAGTLGGVGGLLSLGFLGPLAPVALGLLRLLRAFVKAAFEGLELVITHPVSWIVIGGAALYSYHLGVRRDAYLVAQAKSEVTVLVSKLEGADDADKARAKLAIEAREAAKELPPLAVISVPTVAVGAPNSTAAQPKPDGVREPANKVRRRAKCESLFCP